MAGSPQTLTFLTSKPFERNFVDLNVCFVCRFQSLVPVHCLLQMVGCFPYLLIHDGELLNLLN